MTCASCGRPDPGPVPAASIARLNAPRPQVLTIRAIRGKGLTSRLTAAQVEEDLCRVCADVFGEPMRFQAVTTNEGPQRANATAQGGRDGRTEG